MGFLFEAMCHTNHEGNSQKEEEGAHGFSRTNFSDVFIPILGTQRIYGYMPSV